MPLATRFAAWCVPVGLAFAVAAGGADPKPAADAKPAVDFNRDVRPILSNNCFACHGPDENVRKAKLRLDTRDGALFEDAVVPGKPEKSGILTRIHATDPTEVMPPPKTGKKLTAKEAATLAEWIRQGAPYAKHWSYEKPTTPALPQLPGDVAVRNRIDNFVVSKLLLEGMRQSPEADRHTLARRVALDLTGLPPTPAEVDAFVADPSPGAYERFVDAMLARPAFGEHWARMWLDLARYADSAGYADDPARTIWAYRDYVIRSFNANKKFDRFTIEQIAGDLLPNPTDEQLVATAFHRNTLTNSEGGTSDEEFRNVAVVDRVNTTMAVWMGTSMACAQCHTHKYDPISQKDYFRFFAFLNNTADADRNDESPLLTLASDEQKKQRAELEKEIASLQEMLKAPTPAVLAGLPKWEAAFPRNIAWATPKPTAFAVKSGGTADLADDGKVVVKAGSKEDTYTVELPLTGATLSAVRLESVPDAKLPGGGAGFGNGGNFVISSVKAAVVPPGNRGPSGRFVRVELPGKGKYLMLAEVQVFSGADNVAPKGAAKQSTTDFGGEAKRANDGVTNGKYFEANSVSHTAKQDSPWWEVDLKVSTTVDRIVVWSRTDGNGSLAGAKLTLLDDARKPLWETTLKDAPAPSQALDVGPARPVMFDAAHADHEQPDFGAANVLTPKPQKGWAVGGAIDKPHTLTLTTAKPVDVPAGSKLVVTIEQTYPDHSLARFRIGTTADPKAADVARTPADVLAALTTDPVKRTDAQKKRLTDHYLTLAPELKAERDKLAAVQKQLADLKPTTTVPVLKELPEGQRRTTKVQVRGNFLETGDAVTEGVPSAFHPLPEGEKPTRLAMARWLVSPENPLTARVTVNRFWESIFGVGLVRTSEEFGSQGELPSHPELLDWLAVDFMKDWDVKRHLKLLVTSAAYRQSSKVTPEMVARDPDNRLLGRGPRYRLSAESVRDQALAVSGLLSPKMYGPSVKPPQPSFGLSAAFGRTLDWQTSAGEDKYRRGLYTEWRRTNPYPSMAAFDAPSREACTIRRLRSNTPLQALVTLNDPVYVEAAQAIARKMAATKGTPTEQLAVGFKTCLLRPPTEKETTRLVKLYEDARAVYAKDPAKAKAMATEPIGPLPDGANAAEVAAWTVVGNVLLNLDEMFMRR